MLCSIFDADVLFSVFVRASKTNNVWNVSNNMLLWLIWWSTCCLPDLKSLKLSFCPCWRASPIRSHRHLVAWKVTRELLYFTLLSLGLPNELCLVMMCFSRTMWAFSWRPVENWAWMCRSCFIQGTCRTCPRERHSGEARLTETSSGTF